MSFHWATTDCILLSTLQKTINKTENTVDYKTSLINAYNKTKLLQNIFSEHNRIELLIGRYLENSQVLGN